MISSVVNQSASMAASTAGGKVPQARSTFGKRNIKNQVRKFDNFLKESRDTVRIFWSYQFLQEGG